MRSVDGAGIVRCCRAKVVDHIHAFRSDVHAARADYVRSVLAACVRLLEEVSLWLPWQRVRAAVSVRSMFGHACSSLFFACACSGWTSGCISCRRLGAVLLSCEDCFPWLCVFCGGVVSLTCPCYFMFPRCCILHGVEFASRFHLICVT